jgi:hypothetical protein
MKILSRARARPSIESSSARASTGRVDWAVVLRLHLGHNSELKAGRGRIPRKHPHRLERKLSEVLADHLVGLTEDVVGDGDDGAAGVLGLEDVEDLAGAGPKKFGPGQVGKQSTAGTDHWDRINSSVGNAAGKDGNDGRNGWVEGGGDTGDLLEGEDRGDVEFYAVLPEFLDQRKAGVAARIGDRNLGVNIGGPPIDFEGLAFHRNKIVGENLQRDRLGGHRVENILGKGLVVPDASLPHQGRIGRETLYVGLTVQIEDTSFVGAVSIELDLEVVEGRHRVFRLR